MFSNPPHLSLKRSLQFAHLHNHRVLLVLTGVSNEHLSSICHEISQLIDKDRQSDRHAPKRFATQHANDIMHLPHRHSNSDSSDHINALLGSENRCVIFDAYDAFDERLFAASAGTIVGGGILVLRTPSLKQWPALPGGLKSSHFINRFARKVLMHQSAVLHANELPDETSCLLVADVTANANLTRTELNWLTEQDTLVDQLLSKLLDKNQTTAIVQADRGRGKSTLIGRTLKQLFANKRGDKKRVTITANRSSACNVLLQHAANANTKDCPIRFLPLDQALCTQHELLVVEEAGSISIAVLTKLTALSNDIVFATTVQGYEGAGRGFALRFSKQLDLQRPDWVMLTPQQPVRWSNNDPLEAFVNDALLLKTTLPSITAADDLYPSNTLLTQVDKRTLNADDELLESLYSLLIQAHYQTTPADLRNMLDQEQLLIFTQHSSNVLTGAALVALEGEIPENLHEAIVQKRRRLADQILPQLLAQSAADSTVLDHRYARIVRIAIHPSLHRQGFGTSLFEQLRLQLASKAGSIGASFGADEQTLSFWLKLGLTPIHYGFKANPRSGLRSACLVISEDKSIEHPIAKAAKILNTNLGVLDLYGNKEDKISQLLIDATAKSAIVLTDADKFRLISDFCQSKRSFIDTVGFINPEIEHSVSPDTVEKHFSTLLRTRERVEPRRRRIAEQAVREFVAKTMLPDKFTEK